MVIGKLQIFGMPQSANSHFPPGMMAFLSKLSCGVRLARKLLRTAQSQVFTGRRLEELHPFWVIR